MHEIPFPPLSYFIPFDDPHRKKFQNKTFNDNENFYYSFIRFVHAFAISDPFPSPKINYRGNFFRNENSNEIKVDKKDNILIIFSSLDFSIIVSFSIDASPGKKG